MVWDLAKINLFFLKANLFIQADVRILNTFLLHPITQTHKSGQEKSPSSTGK